MDKWLSNPTALKIISLVIGILLWAVVHFDPESPTQPASFTETKVIEAVKIQTENLNEESMHLHAMEPSVVRIVVSGSRTALAAAAQDEYKVSVNLNGLSEGIHDLPLRVKLPSRLSLVQVSPARVKVELVPVQTRELDVTIKTSGTPANGYKIGTPIVKPGNRVFVTLPKDELETVAMVGATVDVDGAEETINEKRVKLAAYDDTGKAIEGASINPSSVEVEVPITKPFKQLPLQIGFTGQLQPGLSIASLKPNVDQVTVYGPQRALDAMEFFDDVTINLAAIKSSGTIKLALKPTGEIAAVDPQEVTVDIQLAASQSRTLSQVPVTVGGLAEGLSLKFVTPASGAVDLPVSGAPSVIAKLNEKDVQAIADLEGLTPGRHTLVLDVHLPSFVSAGYATPPTVVVDIASADEGAEPPADDGSVDGGGNVQGGAVNDAANGGIIGEDGGEGSAGTDTGGAANEGDGAADAGTNTGVNGGVSAGGDAAAGGAGEPDAGSNVPADTPVNDGVSGSGGSGGVNAGAEEGGAEAP